MKKNAHDQQNATETLPDFVGQDIQQGTRIVFIAVGIAMVLCGVIGNGLFLTVLSKQFRRRRSIHILFVANLCLADLVTLGYWFSFFVLDLILKRHPVVNMSHCVFNGAFIATMYLVSVTFLVSISLNRYLHVCHSHLYSRVFTLPRTVAWCLLTWLASSLISAIPVLDGEQNTTYEYSRGTHICTFSRERITYVKMIAIVWSTLPMLFIAYCNIAIFRFWKRAKLSTSGSLSIGERSGMGQKLLACWRAGVEKLKRNDSIAIVRFSSQRDIGNEELSGSDSPETSVLELEPEDHDDAARARSRDDDVNDVEVFDSRSRSHDNDGTTMTVAEDRGRMVADSTKHEERKTESPLNTTPTLLNLSVMDEIPLTNESKEVAENSNLRDSHTVSGICQQPVAAQETAEVDTQNAPASPSATASQPSLKVTSVSQKPLGLGSSATHQAQHHDTPTLDLQRLQRRKKAKEEAFIRSLFIVFLLAVFSFIPFGAITVAKLKVSVSAEVVMIGNFFLFLNNSVNWIVYGVINAAFRDGYTQLFTACCPGRRVRAQIQP
ncbi:probable muscarinic acetylcholine receptor gar-1 [Littorina saxatilis]|uniref:G-protein coupled receptors family 1 profile domain-containing protein n=1 Tax=Littorina saxatilis TaxID=31220 RepID=A0AAN9AIM4_9CAEN